MNTRKVSKIQEEQLAKKLGGKVTSNSGGTKFGGGDVLTTDFLIEAKTPMTEQKAISIKKEWLEKAKEQSFEQRKDFWALAFRFDPDVNEDYFVVNEKVFKEFLYFIRWMEGG
jgi:hypothetical protein